MSASSRLLCLLTVGGCARLQQAPDYYEGVWDPPSISGLSVSAEVGNVGGATVDLSGAGFGSDPDEVVVVFGDHNASVLAVADDRLTVVVPAGPLSGGAVDVKVATATGYAITSGAYTYDTGTIGRGETAYIQVNNYWESCLGGLSSRLDDAYDSVLGGLCETVVYNGYAGLTGSSEGFGLVYPRVHAPYVGYYSSGDLAGPAWVVERPGAINFAAGLEDLHEDIGTVTLHNAYYTEDGAWCANLGSLAGYRYGGGTEDAPDPAMVYPYEVVDGHAGTCTPEEAATSSAYATYDMSALHFCTTPDAAGSAGHVYEADWPVVANFFEANARNPRPVDITVDIPDVDIEGQPLALPESILVRAGEGFVAVSGDVDADADLWTLADIDGCFDDDGDGEDLDDVALSFTWTPSSAELTAPGEGAVTAGTTWVRMTITEIAYNWLGSTGYPVRATVTVPDDYGYDARTGLSELEVPASILYQFPTVRFPGGAAGTLLDPASGDWGFLMVTVDRVTEYALAPPAGGEILFSYATGDIGVFSWTNPMDGADCLARRGG